MNPTLRLPDEPLRIAVVCGGFSHEANYSSSAWVVDALRQLGHHPIELRYEQPAFLDTLREARVDIVFPQTLGAYGEDGTLQGLLDYLGIPYVGSGVGASAACANKWMCSQFIGGLAAREGRTDFGAPDSLPVHASFPCSYDSLVDRLGTPFVLKPMLSGASFGVEIIRTQARFEAVHVQHLNEFEWLLAEKFVSGVEYCWGFIEDASRTLSLPATLVQDNQGKTVYSQGDKLEAPSEQQMVVPQGDAAAVFSHLEEVGSLIARALGLRGCARMDIIVDDQGCARVLDINTLPGLLPALSMLPLMCSRIGIPYLDMIATLVASARRPQPMRMRKISDPPEAPRELVLAAQARLAVLDEGAR